MRAVGLFKRVKDLAVEAVKEQVSDRWLEDLGPPVTPTAAFAPGRAVLQLDDFRPDGGEGRMWGTTDVRAKSKTRFRVAVRAWLGPDEFGPQANLAVWATQRTARALQPGMSVPATFGPDGVVTDVDMERLDRELEANFDGQGRWITTRASLTGVIRDANEKIRESIDRTAEELAATRADLAGDSSEEEFHTWIRVQTALASGAIPDAHREQALQALGVPAGTFDDLDRRCRESLTTNPDRAAYYQRATGGR